jgi:hypothetical protein
MTVKHILITMFVPLSFGAFYIWLATHPAPPPTPEEQAAYRQQEANRAQQQAERAARFATLCKQQQMCKRYKDAVKNCAPAANFDTCMKILMPGEDIVSQMSCLSDGSVRQPSVDMPSTFVCLLNGYP